MSDFLILDDDKNKSPQEDSSYKSTTSFTDYINWLLLSFQKLKAKEKVVFYRLLATMVNSGMSLLQSIIVLEKQEKNPVFKKILIDITENLREWSNLSECFEQHHINFSEAEVGIIKSWEKTGQLNIALLQLADQIEKVASISGKIKWAMIYPFFIILVVVAVVAVLLVKIIPTLLEIFPDKESLPPLTKSLMAVSDFMIAYGIYMLLVFVGLLLLLNFWKKTPTWKYIFDDFILKIPIFWWINRKMILSKFSRIFAWLLSSWVSIIETLNIVATAVWSEVYKQRIILLWEDVAKGIKIWESLDGDKLFPEMMVQMIQVWEQTAKLDQTIIKVADFYDEEIDETVKILNKLLEPFIIVTLAVIVGIIAMAIMQPILSLSETVGN